MAYALILDLIKLYGEDGYIKFYLRGEFKEKVMEGKEREKLLLNPADYN